MHVGHGHSEFAFTTNGSWSHLGEGRKNSRQLCEPLAYRLFRWFCDVFQRGMWKRRLSQQGRKWVWRETDAYEWRSSSSSLKCRHYQLLQHGIHRTSPPPAHHSASDPKLDVAMLSSVRGCVDETHVRRYEAVSARSRSTSRTPQSAGKRLIDSCSENTWVVLWWVGSGSVTK